uniref:Uncharacterized protein n=1 Tax=Anguilla anguilla TaxID=7936 RepID=A0A0E9USW5_ANGAN
MSASDWISKVPSQQSSLCN